jgi:hypothetical protein
MRSIRFTVISTAAMRSIAQWRNLINNSNWPIGKGMHGIFEGEALS